jgi:hypothetical protein
LTLYFLRIALTAGAIFAFFSWDMYAIFELLINYNTNIIAKWAFLVNQKSTEQANILRKLWKNIQKVAKMLTLLLGYVQYIVTLLTPD